MWRALRPFVIVGSLVGIFTGVILIGGPLSSGMLLLALPIGLPGEPHDLDPSYEPQHGGGVVPATGLYFREDEDLLLTGTPPFVLKRTYRSRDAVSRSFGIGASSNAEWYLIADRHLQWAELILEDGARVHFDRISRGTSYLNARLASRGDGPMFREAHLGWTGRWWLIWDPGGTRAWFRDCPANPGPPCSLLQLRDADGHTVDFSRNDAGLAHVIAAGGQTIVLTFDALDRVVSGRSSAGREMAYEYDPGGRLVRASGSDGVTRTYAYGPRDELVAIQEPGRVIHNEYDEALRVTRQVTERTDRPGRVVFEFAYRTSGDEVVETEVTEPDGTHTVYRYEKRRSVLEIYDARGPNPVMLSVDRRAGDGAVIGLTARCVVDGRRVTRSTEVSPEDDDSFARQQFVAEVCGSGVRIP